MILVMSEGGGYATLTKFTVEDGWIRQASRIPSPNCGPRPAGVLPDLLVIHNISLPPGCYGGDAIERFFTNCLDCDEHPYYEEIRGLQVSAHLLIRRGGELIQFVDLRQRAWHAGASFFGGRENCNDFSIGVELEGTDEDPYTDLQYRVLVGVSLALRSVYPEIGMEHIVGHSDISPGRKTDPGPAFDWGRYRRALDEAGGMR